MTDKEYIWNYFVNKIGNKYGVAGLMGNLQQESGLHCDRLQGDIPYSSASIEYTEKVDNGTISEYDFVHNGPNGGGYGLAQWTFYTRKQNLYDTWKSGGYSSIGSRELACDYLWWELQHSYPTVLSVLLSATNIREASDVVLHDFENPADQSTSVEELRESLGTAIYNELSGSVIDPDIGGDHGGSGGSGGSSLKRKKFNFLVFQTARKRYMQYAKTRIY